MTKHLTAKQLAEHFQVAPLTIYRWKEKGLPFKRIGSRSIRFDLDEVNSWLANKTDSRMMSSNSE